MITLVLPMYNEEESIPLLRKEAAACPFIDRIIPVNDGSIDKTLCLLEEWAQADSRIDIVSYYPNRGLPGAVQAGLSRALSHVDADIIVTMDSDASHPMSLIPLMAERIHSGFDIVIASRHAPGASQQGLTLFRRILSWGASLLMRLVFPIKGLNDYSTNYRAYSSGLLRRALVDESPMVEATDFSGVVELLLRLCSLQVSISEVPLDLRYDQKVSASKARILRIIKGYLRLAFMSRVRHQTGICLPLLRNKHYAG